MALTKRIDGIYSIATLTPGTTVIGSSMSVDTGTLTINGNLVVTGTSTAVESVDMTIDDHVINLNDGETGAGVTASEVWGAEIPASSVASSGIRIKRGTNNDVGIRYNESTTTWQITNDGITWNDIVSGVITAIDHVHEDVSPSLGGNLDVNGWKIVSNAGQDTNSNSTTDTLDITISPVASGEFRVDSDSTTGSGISVQEQASDPSSIAGYNKVYAKTPSTGGSGVFFTNTTETDELVSKTKAIVFGIVF